MSDTNEVKVIGTNKTPTVEFNAAEGKMLLKGRSIPENSMEFYRPLMNWLHEYARSPQEETVLTIYLEYFNTSSSKCLLDIMRLTENIAKNGSKKVSIEWLYDYDDPAMKEAGEDYESIVSIPFNFVPVEY